MNAFPPKVKKTKPFPVNHCGLSSPLGVNFKLPLTANEPSGHSVCSNLSKDIKREFERLINIML